MKDVASGIWGRLAGYLESWLLPSAAAVAFLGLVLLPAVADRPLLKPLTGLGAGSRAAVFVLATLLVSFLMESAARPLAQLLEGYTLPDRLAGRLRERQLRRWYALRSRIAAADRETALRLRPRLDAYPRDAEYLLPTRLGNALRAGETYGWVQYRLSTVDLWTRLVAVAEERVVDQIQQAGVRLNLFLALIGLSVALVPIDLAVAVWSGRPSLLWWLVPLLGLLPVWYDRAVAAVAWYAQGMQAMVDLSRSKLAEAIGVHLPGDIAAERAVWQAVSNYVGWGRGWSGTEEWVATINAALVPTGAALPDPPTGADGAGTDPAKAATS